MITLTENKIILEIHKKPHSSLTPAEELVMYRQAIIRVCATAVRDESLEGETVSIVLNFLEHLDTENK